MFDLQALKAAVAQHGRVTRIVIAAIEGSSPREVGASMLVWARGFSGTIGGGALEWEAMRAARSSTSPEPRLTHEALGPKLGQCCGGRVTLLSEVFEAATLKLPQFQPREGHILRPLPSASGDMPLSLHRKLAGLRNGSLGGLGARAVTGDTLPQPSAAHPAPRTAIPCGIEDGWMVEPLAKPNREIWVWGAGHVGRAIVGIMAPLPEFALTWIDTSRDRFPDVIPDGVTPLWSDAPQMLISYSPASAEHVIATYSHSLDLEICHRLLIRQDFRSSGLIGSETKRARFRSRLAALGHSNDAIDRIRCPIGDPRLGKAPQAIAIGVAADMLRRDYQAETEITDDDRDCRAVAHRGRDESLSGSGR